MRQLLWVSRTELNKPGKLVNILNLVLLDARLSRSQRACFRTSYFIVLTSGTPVSSGAYNWSIGSGGFTAIGGWYPGGDYLASPDGSSWVGYRPNPFQYAVNATAIPEPPICALVGLGLVGLSFWRGKHRQKVAHHSLEPRPFTAGYLSVRPVNSASITAIRSISARPLCSSSGAA
jgi:hypothetical protein